MENATLLTWRLNFSMRHQKAFGLCSLGRRTFQHAAVNHVGCPVGSISRVTTHTRDDYPFSLQKFPKFVDGRSQLRPRPTHPLDDFGLCLTFSHLLFVSLKAIMSNFTS